MQTYNIFSAFTLNDRYFMLTPLFFVHFGSHQVGVTQALMVIFLQRKVVIIIFCIPRNVLKNL